MRLSAGVMNASRIERIHSLVEQAACLLFAAAVGFAAFKGLHGFFGQFQPGIGAVCASAVAYLLCHRLLIRRAFELPGFSLPKFEPAEIEPSEMDELVLTDAERFVSEPATTDQNALVLDDILAELGPDSRVVRLFDRTAMPSPGYLKSRIDSHLEQRSPPTAPDASQALSDALAELRRSLR